jgi:hypothetical protein
MNADHISNLLKISGQEEMGGNRPDVLVNMETGSKF